MRAKTLSRNLKVQNNKYIGRNRELLRLGPRRDSEPFNRLQNVQQAPQGWKVSQFLQKAQNTIVGKLINSFAKLIDKVSKIGDTTTFKVKDPFNNRHSSERHSEVKEDLPNIDQSPRKPQTGCLTEEQNKRLKELEHRKQELLVQLNRINKMGIALALKQPSQSSGQSRLNDRKSELTQLDTSGNRSRLKLGQYQQTYDVAKHSKAMKVLARLSEQKVQRQERMIDQMKRKHEEQLKKVQRLKKNLKEDHPKEIRERTKRKDNKVNSTLSRINARQHVQVLSNQASEDVTETHRNSSRGGQSEPLKSEWKQSE